MKKLIIIFPFIVFFAGCSFYDETKPKEAEIEKKEDLAEYEGTAYIIRNENVYFFDKMYKISELVGKNKKLENSLEKIIKDWENCKDHLSVDVYSGSNNVSTNCITAEELICKKIGRSAIIMTAENQGKEFSGFYGKQKPFNKQSCEEDIKKIYIDNF